MKAIGSPRRGNYVPVILLSLRTDLDDISRVLCNSLCEVGRWLVGKL